MPRCQGLPNGPCPGQRNDNSVKLGEGDLNLCKSCNEERFRLFLATRPTSSSSAPAAPSEVSVQSAGGNHAQSGAAKKQGKSSRSSRSASASATTTASDATAQAATAPDDNSVQCLQDEVFECVDTIGDRCKKILINELAISFYRDKGNCDKFQNIVLTFFSSTDIADAKKILIDNFGRHLSDSLNDVRTSMVHAAHEAELEDIFAAFDLLDVNNVLSRCHFVALNLDLLHKHGPEDTTVGSVSFKQENHIEKLDGDICRLQQK